MSVVSMAKDLFQRNLQRFGWEIKRVNSGDIADLMAELNAREVVKLLDVGANLGQYAKAAFDVGFSGEVLSFEPLSDIHARLAHSAEAHPRWRVHPRCAVGSTKGKVTINRAANAVSSSVLAISDIHVFSAPSSRITGTEEVPVIALDDIGLTDPTRTFLKIDTQGFEGEVLKGAKKLLRQIAGVQVEISIAPLYEDQAEYAAIFDAMHSAGLRLWSVEPGFRDQKTRRLLQFDAIFLRMLRPKSQDSR